MSRKQLIVCGGLLIGSSIACWFFPLFHIRRLDASDGSINVSNSTTDKGNSSGDSRQLEIGEPLKLESYTSQGTEVTKLWDAFEADKATAKKLYGRQAGLGGAWYFCVRGQATVASVELDRVILTVANSSRRVCLQLGAVVDNTVRESVGVKASDFANSQEFNAVSTALNLQVEQEVVATNRSLLKPGTNVEFVGCAKISRDTDLDPLCLIPIQLNVSSDAGAALRGEMLQLSVVSKTLQDGKQDAYPTGKQDEQSTGKQDACLTGPSL